MVSCAGGDFKERPHEGEVFGFNGAIATEHYLSAQAGMQVMQQGGNAFDAAAAATLVESLVNPHHFTLGGECPMLLYPAGTGKVVAINGNTEAPRSISIDAFAERGLSLIPGDGVLSAGPPAAFSALIEMLIRFGRLPFETIAEPALLLAREGFPVHLGLRASIENYRETFLSQWPNTAKLYLEPDKSAPQAGRRLENTALADTLDLLCAKARRAGRKGGREAGLRAAVEEFYRGGIAREIAEFVCERDGFLREEDMARFETYCEEPTSTSFRNTTVFKCGPWSQGPVFLQILKLLEGFDLDSHSFDSPDYLHLWIESAKLAFADREQYYADPRFASVPMDQLLSADYTSKRRGLIDEKKASLLHAPGDPVKGQALLPPGDVFLWESWGYGTVHVAVADRDGNMAALTPSGGWIRSNEVIPTLGFALTSRIQTFILDKRHPNALVPGKRPRTTLSPSLAFRDGRPWMAFGTMGGDNQDQWTSQFFLNRVIFGMSLQEAIEAPKLTSTHMPSTFHPHDAYPGKISIEGRMPFETIRDLRSRGHLVGIEPDWVLGYICAVARNEEGLLLSGADPRGSRACVFPSRALAW